MTAADSRPLPFALLPLLFYFVLILSHISTLIGEFLRLRTRKIAQC